MAWISLILAGLCEMFGVAMINKLHKDRNWQSLVLLILAFGAILGMVLYGESKDWRRLVFIGMVLGAAIGLKLVS